MKFTWPAFLRPSRFKEQRARQAEVYNEGLADWRERLSRIPASQLPAFERRMRSESANVVI